MSSYSSSRFKQQPTRANCSFFTGFLILFSCALVAFTLLCIFPPSYHHYLSTTATSSTGSRVGVETLEKGPMFNDDPKFGYMIGDNMDDWDEKRQEWLRKNAAFGDGGRRRGVSERMLVVTGSQLKPCRNPIGDNLLLRSFKNKVDYCRINEYDIFYNNLLLHPKMWGPWAKLPAIRAAMLSHPETEWILWMDADAFFVNMEFKFPFHRYKDHNFVVQGWNTYERRSYTSLNAGVFLIRNCQWSMDFIEVWAKMGPQSPDFEKWGKIQQDFLKDKTAPAGDQRALLYLMIKKRKTWGDKIFLEEDLNFQSHWVGVMDQLDNFTKAEMIIKDSSLRNRNMHAEKKPNVYDTERRVKERGWVGPPIMIHFAGCQPCSGKHNPAYSAEDCWKGMDRALTFADNQVIRNFGLVHLDLSNGSSVWPLKHV